MERKRIYSIGTWFFFLVLLAVQIALYVSNQTKAVELSGSNAEEWKESDDSESNLTVDSVNLAYRDFLMYAKELGVDSPEEFYEYQEQLAAYREKLGDNGYWAYTNFSNQLSKRAFFRSTVQSILDSAGQMSNISIFNKDSASSIANREKTAEDFSKTLDIRWEISPTYAVTSVLSGRESVFLLMLWILVIVWQFGAERKLGLWGMLYQTVGGREKLAGKRIGVLAGSAFFATVVFYGTLLIGAMLRYGGVESLSEPVQLIDAFYRIPYRITVGEMVVIDMLFTAVGLFLLGLILWVCLTVFMNRTLSMVVFLIVMAGEYLCYTRIGNKSVLALLYHMNLFHLLFPYNWMTEYLNYAIGGIAIPRYILITGFAVGASLLVSVLLIILNRNIRPVYSVGWIERFLKKLDELKNRILEWLPLPGKELYKLLFHQKALLFILLVLYVTVDGYKVSGVVYDSIYGNIQKEFYETCSGPLGENAYAYERSLEEQIQSYGEEKEAVKLSYEEGELSLNEYVNRTQVLTDNMNKTGELYGKVSSQILYLENLEEETDIRGWILDERGYETMLGKRNYSSQLTLGLVTVLSVLLIASVLFSQEEQAGMKSLLNSTGGRNRLVIKKYAVMTGVVFLIWCCSYMLNIRNMISVYKLSDFGAPVQSIRHLADFPLRVSVGGFLIWLYGMRFVMLLLTAFLAMFLSRKCRYYQSILLSVVLLLPHMICLLGVKGLRILSVVYPLAFLQDWADYGSSIRMWLPYVVLFVLGALSVLPPDRR